jgi:anti-anti-sigma factor
MHLIGDTQDSIRVLALGGEIDLHFAPVLRTLLDEKTEVPLEALVLDLSEVPFIDSSGLAAIIEHLRKATRAGSGFCIGGMSSAVKEILEVICLRKVMPVFETRDAALEAIRTNQIKNPDQPLFAAAG